MDAQQTKSPSLVTDLQINLRICQHAFKFLPDTVSDKNSWDTLTKRCFFPSRAPLVPLKVFLSRCGHQFLYTNIETVAKSVRVNIGCLVVRTDGRSAVGGRCTVT